MFLQHKGAHAENSEKHPVFANGLANRPFPCPSLPCFFFIQNKRRPWKPQKKQGLFHPCRTPKIPGKEGKNAQQIREFLAREKNKNKNSKTQGKEGLGFGLVILGGFELSSLFAEVLRSRARETFFIFQISPGAQRLQYFSRSPSGIDIFKREWTCQASHTPRPFFLQKIQARLEFSSVSENFKRDCFFSGFGPLVRSGFRRRGPANGISPFFLIFLKNETAIIKEKGNKLLEKEENGTKT